MDLNGINRSSHCHCGDLIIVEGKEEGRVTERRYYLGEIGHNNYILKALLPQPAWQDADFEQ